MLNTNSPLGMNLGKIESWTTSWAFVDEWRHARPWADPQGGALDLDEHGWVRSLNEGQVAENFFTHAGHYPDGVYNAFYEGDGQWTWSGDATVLSEQPGQVLLNVQPSDTGIHVRLTATNPANYIRNIRLIRPGFAETYTTQPFHPRFLELCSSYKVLRFMDWLQTNDSPITSWSERTTPETAHQRRGVAFEYVIALCNTLQTDAWINIPHRADDDYVVQLATLLRDTLDPVLKIYVEYSNEVWNGQFDQAGYATIRGQELWENENITAVEARRRFYAQRSVEIFQQFEAVFGGTDRLERVLGGQATNPTSARNLLLWNDAYQHADALAIAPYIGGQLGRGDTQDEIEALPVEAILDRVQADIAPVMAIAKQHVRNAADLGLDLIAYEAGQHLVGVGSARNNEQLTQKFIAANRHPRMCDIYVEYLTRWQAIGGKTCCMYNLMSNPSRFGSWGILEHYDQDPLTVPKFQGVAQFNEVAGRWWEEAPAPALPTGAALIDFDAAALPTDGVLNRAVEPVSDGATITGSRIPFSMEPGHHFFTTDNNQGRFFGGYQSDYAPNPQPADPVLQLRSNDDRFHARLISSAGVPSAQTVLLLWQSADFLTESPPFTLGRLAVELGDVSPEHAELRFVVGNGTDWFFSDAIAGATGFHELIEFNHSAFPEHRWAPFQPTATVFAIPEYPVNFTPLIFDNVTAVGFLYYGRRRQHAHSFQFIRFSANSAVDEEVAAIIARAPEQEWLTSSDPVMFTVVFNRAVTGFAAEDVIVRGTAQATTVTVAEIAPHNGATYQIEVSGMQSDGSVIVDIPAGAATHGDIPNRRATSLDNYVYYRMHVNGGD